MRQTRMERLIETAFGHPFGLKLSSEDRTALIAFLRTL